MNFRVLRQWRALFLGLVALLSFCLVHAADNLQAIPELSSPVIDLTNTLTPEQQQALSQKLIAFHDKYGAQMQVLVIPTSAPEDAFTYSMRVVEKWKLGSKEKDDGLLLFIAKDDRRSQIQVGYGLEGTIPDVIAHRLLNDVMAPYFKQGDFYGGINAVIDGVYAKISGDASLTGSLPDGMHSINVSYSVFGQTVSSHKDFIRANFLVWMLITFCVFKILKYVLDWLGAALVGGPLVFLASWLFIGFPVVDAFLLTLLILVLALSPNRRTGYYSGYGGGFGGGWSGGGGGFGGGGAGGRW